MFQPFSKLLGRKRSSKKSRQVRVALRLETLEALELLSVTLTNGSLYNSSGPQSQLIDTSVQTFKVLGNTVFDLHTDHTLWRLNADGTGKIQADSNVMSFDVAPDGHVYDLSLGRMLSQSATSAIHWNAISGPDIQTFAVAPDSSVYSLNFAHVLSRSPSSVIQWTGISGPDIQSFAVSADGSVYSLNFAHVLSQSPTSTIRWGAISGPDVQAFAVAPDSSIYDLNFAHVLSRSANSVIQWAPISGPDVQSFAVSGDGHIYTLNFGHVLSQSVTSVIRWNAISGPDIQGFVVAPDSTIYSLNSAHTVSRSPSPVINWIPISDRNVMALLSAPDGRLLALDSGGLLLTASGPSDLLHRWSGITGTTDAIGGSQATLIGGALLGSSAFSFGQDGAGVVIPNRADLNLQASGFSVDFWMQGVHNQPQSLFLVVDKSHGFADTSGWVFQGTSSTGQIFFGIGSAGGFPGVMSRSDVLDGHPHHIAGTWDGTTMTLYVDGVFQGSMALTAPINNSRDVHIGYSWGGGAPQRFFRGAVANLEIAGRALSPSEIQTIYNNGPGATGLHPVDSGVAQVAVAGDGTIYARHFDGTLLQWTADGKSKQVDSNVAQIASRGDGWVFDLHYSGVLTRFGPASFGSGQWPTDMNVAQIAAAGDGSVYDRHSDGGLLQWTTDGNYHSVDGNVAQIAQAGDGSVYSLHKDGGLWRFVNGAGFGVASNIKSFFFAPNGAVVAVSNDSFLWAQSDGHPAPGTTLQRLSFRPVISFAFAPSGALVVLDNAGFVYQMCTATGGLVQSNWRQVSVSINGDFGNNIKSFAFAPNGALLALSNDGFLYAQADTNPAPGTALQRLSFRPIVSYAFGLNGALTVLDNAGFLYQMCTSIGTGGLVQSNWRQVSVSINGDFGNNIKSFAIDPYGSILAKATDGFLYAQIDAHPTPGARLTKISARPVVSYTFVPNGSLVLLDNAGFLYQFTTPGQGYAPIVPGHGGYAGLPIHLTAGDFGNNVTSFLIDPYGAVLAVGTDGFLYGQCHASPALGEPLQRISALPVSAIHFAPDGSLVLLDNSGSIFQFQHPGQGYSTIGQAPIPGPAAPRLAPNIASFAIAGDRNIVALTTDGVLQELNPAKGWVALSGNDIASFAINPSGDVVALTKPGALQRLSPVGAPTAWVPLSGTNIASYSILPDGSILALRFDNHQLWLRTPDGAWGAITGTNIASFALMPDGSVLALRLDNHQLWLRTPDGAWSAIVNDIKFFTVGRNGHLLMLTKSGDLLDLANPRVPSASTKIEQYVDMFVLDGHGGMYVLQFGQLFYGPVGATWRQTEMSRVRGPVGNNHALDGNVLEIASDGHGGLYVLFSGNDLWDITYASGARASQRKISDDVDHFYFDAAGNLQWDKTKSFWEKVGDFFANLAEDFAAFAVAGIGDLALGPVGAYVAGETVGKAIFGGDYWDYAARGGIIAGSTALTIVTAGALSEVTAPIIAAAVGGAAGSTFSATANSLYFHSAFDWRSIVVASALGAIGGYLKSLSSEGGLDWSQVDRQLANSPLLADASSNLTHTMDAISIVRSYAELARDPNILNVVANFAAKTAGTLGFVENSCGAAWLNFGINTGLLGISVSNLETPVGWLLFDAASATNSLYQLMTDCGYWSVLATAGVVP